MNLSKQTNTNEVDLGTTFPVYQCNFSIPSFVSKQIAVLPSHSVENLQSYEVVLLFEGITRSQLILRTSIPDFGKSE